MTDARSTYDETNEVWPYFVLTVLGVVLIPLTIGQVFRLFTSTKKGQAVASAHAEFRSRSVRKRQLYSFRFWFVVVGWAAMAVLLGFLRRIGNSTVVASPEVWDPYEILKVAKSATLKEIRSAYRKLSLEYHPDKVKDITDATKEQIEAVYVEISKAYRALTDEDTRENFLRYGHPDGPQPVTHGIALPAFLFNPAASVSFIATYLLGFGVGIPVVVGKWWEQSQKRTRKGILQNTASSFCELLAKEQAHFISTERILNTVLLSPDLDEALRQHGHTPSSLNYEKRKDILNSYLQRNKQQSQLELLIASESVRILLALHDIAAVFRSYIFCQRVIKLRRTIIQAIPEAYNKSADYLQLKGAEIDSTKPSDVVEPSKAVLDNARSYFPRIRLLSANFRVNGESQVTTSSQAHLEIKFLVLPLGDKMPELTDSEINPEGELTKFHDPSDANKKQPPLPDAVAPFFPLDIQTSWYVYLYGELDNKLMEMPLEVNNMDLHNLTLSREQVEKGDDIVIGTLIVKISTVTPPTPQSIPLKVAVLSETYFGTDLQTRVVMNVVQPSEPIKQDTDLDGEEEEESKDEESEDEVEGLSDLDTDTEEEDNVEESR